MPSDIKMKDYHKFHLNQELRDGDIILLNDRKHWRKRLIKSIDNPDSEFYHFREANHSLNEPFKIKPSLLQNFQRNQSRLPFNAVSIPQNIESNLKTNTMIPQLHLNEVQSQMVPYMFSYQDIFFPQRDQDNGPLIRDLYCLHVLNHAHSTRQLILQNNVELEKGVCTANTHEMIHGLKPSSILGTHEHDLRDRGFTRPKTLIVVPFRNSAFKIVDTLINLMSTTTTNNKLVTNKRRFYQEFQDPNEDDGIKYPSEERKELFSGNIDDCFKVGIGLGKKSLKLYTDFYASDIIICSPLGLKTLGTLTKKIVNPKDSIDLTNGKMSESEIVDKDTVDESLDFLSSIEILILDQADVFMMQNWSHVDYLMKMINNRPIKAHDTDFSRVREWYLNGWSRHYRQTLIFSRVNSPQINQIFHSHCSNLEGKALIYHPPECGTLDRISTSLTHTFLKIEPTPSDPLQLLDFRFNFFTQTVVPQISGNRKLGRRTLVFIPSYFDFVRIRNYLMDEEIPFLSITEYDDERHIKRVRRLIRLSHLPSVPGAGDDDEANAHSTTTNSGSEDERHLLILNTERSYFFRKPRVPHVDSIVFYQAPTYPTYYADLCEDAAVAFTTHPAHARHPHEHGRYSTSTVIYDPRYDWFALLPLLGTNRTESLIRPGVPIPRLNGDDESRPKRIKSLRYDRVSDSCPVVFITGASHPKYLSSVSNSRAV